MLFLKDVVAHRKLQGNTSPKRTITAEEDFTQSTAQSSPIAVEAQDLPQTQDTHSGITHDESEEASSSSQFSQVSSRGSAPERLQPPVRQAATKRKRNIAQNIEDDQYLQLERRKIEILSESVASKQNSDYQFLQSLLPFLMKVPAHRKLAVRNKLQQVLIEEEERAFQPTEYHSPAEHLTTPVISTSGSLDSFSNYPQPPNNNMTTPLSLPSGSLQLLSNCPQPPPNYMPSSLGAIGDPLRRCFASFPGNDSTMS